MPVDFARLPVEETFNVKPPSVLRWAVVFIVMAVLGGVAVLWLWPEDMPTDTWRFWITLIFFPMAVPAIVVLRRFACHESRRLDVELQNAAVNAFNARVFHAASIPLALIGSAHRFSADPALNAAQALQSGALKLTTRTPPARNATPVNARWLEVPDMPAEPGTINGDVERAHQLTAWLMNDLLEQLAPRLLTFPMPVPLIARLQVDNALPDDANRALWEASWGARSLRSIPVETANPPDNLMMLDGWMDRLLAGGARRALLLVSIQLHPLLSGSPPAGSAEAAVALLLMPDSLAHQHGVARLANLHRPVRGMADTAQEALSNALRWGRAAVGQIGGAWQTGLDTTQAGALQQVATRTGTTIESTELDRTVGHAGGAAAWLAVACGAASLTASAAPQLVMVGQGASVDCAVLKRPGAARGAAAVDIPRRESR